MYQTEFRHKSLFVNTVVLIKKKQVAEGTLFKFTLECLLCCFVVSDFELIEIPFEALNLKATLEDDFLKARITAELDQATNAEELRDAAKSLLNICVLRQAAIRGLCERLVQYETAALRTIRKE